MTSEAPEPCQPIRKVPECSANSRGDGEIFDLMNVNDDGDDANGGGDDDCDKDDDVDDDCYIQEDAMTRTTATMNTKDRLRLEGRTTIQSIGSSRRRTICMRLNLELFRRNTYYY